MKNTMIGVLADWLCPLSCMSCGVTGELLCECCRKNMSPRLELCLKCGAKLQGNVCKNCKLSSSHQFCLGPRVGALKELINLFKYQSLRPAGRVLVSCLLERLDFNNDDVVVPLPTIQKHVRERGYGHIELLARYLSRNSPVKIEKLLVRAKNTVQVGSSSEKRKQQAKEAYALGGKIDPSKNYYLLDDVWTTGSSMLSAVKILCSAGAQYVNIIVLAKTA